MALDLRNLHINVNPGSKWYSFPPDAFLIGNTMRSTSMTDDIYYGQLRGSFVHREDNFSFSQDRSVQGPSVHDRNTSVRHHGQKVITEMVIGPWYLDEFGNPTREIKARD
jgi:hypothetical protein